MKRFTMNNTMGKISCRIGRVVLLAALVGSAFSPASAFASDFDSDSDEVGAGTVTYGGSQMLQASIVPIREHHLQNRNHEPARASRVALSADEAQLYRMIMEYRRENGLPSIPLSPSLTRVAKLHVRDLEAHPPSGSGNLHSWSEYGPWKPVCYRGSENIERMWSKPRELTSYRGNGYEIAAATSRQMLPDHALSLWEGSSAHNCVMINLGKWDRLQWHAIGLAMSGSYAVVWFGEEPDNAKR
jgi:hypothetical protein